MCLAIPAKVIAISGDMATAELEGAQVEACIALLPEVQIGDYIIVHAGYALQRMDESEAAINLDYLRQMYEND
jgi:hydrogenase expression/formation protein HypC